MDTHSLYELNGFIRQALALNFPDPLWVRAEISRASRSRGHAYLQLVEKAEATDDVLAQADAVCWRNRLAALRRRHGPQLDSLLQDGMEVRLRVNVTFHERYGLSLQVDDIDPAFTLGQVELRRRQILETLQAEGLLGKNGSLPLPPVMQRIAVLSNEQAAGWHDFRAHLRDNPWQYHFDLTLLPTALQGDRVEPEITRQLEKIERNPTAYDAVFLLRGGGSRLDLSAFDSLPLARRVAALPLPFFTGIGHEIDLTVLDGVAHTALKTPTAAANFLVDHHAAFEGELTRWGQALSRLADHRLTQAGATLRDCIQGLQYGARHALNGEKARLEYLASPLPAAARRRLERESDRLDRLLAILRERDPQHILRRGFTLTYQDGKALRGASEANPEGRLRTLFWDGALESTILNLPKSPNGGPQEKS